MNNYYKLLLWCVVTLASITATSLLILTSLMSTILLVMFINEPTETTQLLVHFYLLSKHGAPAYAH